MEQSYLPDWLNAGLAVLRSFAPIGASLCGGGVLWKLVDKLIDVSESRRKDREANEGESNKELRGRTREMEKELRDSYRQVAEIPFLRESNADLKRQLEISEDRVDDLQREKSLALVQHEREVRRLQGENAQLTTNNRVAMEILQLVNDQQGMEYLARRRAERGNQ